MSNAVKVALVICTCVCFVVVVCCAGLLVLAKISPPTAPIPAYPQPSVSQER